MPSGRAGGVPGRGRGGSTTAFFRSSDMNLLRVCGRRPTGRRNRGGRFLALKGVATSLLETGETNSHAGRGLPGQGKSIFQELTPHVLDCQSGVQGPVQGGDG